VEYLGDIKGTCRTGLDANNANSGRVSGGLDARDVVRNQESKTNKRVRTYHEKGSFIHCRKTGCSPITEGALLHVANMRGNLAPSSLTSD
jgi:hypothetical protein